MVDNAQEEVSFAVMEGVGTLSALSRDDYRMDLRELLSDPERTDEERLMRVGRLMGVALKQPFSSSHPLDPSLSRTGAFRAWDLRDDLLQNPLAPTTWQYALMDKLKNEDGHTSVESLAWSAFHEAGFFYYLKESFRAYVCGDPVLRDKLDQSAAELQGRSGPGQLLSPHALLGAGGTMMATTLVQAIPWLTLASAPILAGFVVIVGTIGVDAFCRWSAQVPPTAAEEER
jgi:hypothetical protein